MQEVQFYERAQAQTHSMTLACMAQVQQYRAQAAEWGRLAAEQNRLQARNVSAL